MRVSVTKNGYSDKLPVSVTARPEYATALAVAIDLLRYRHHFQVFGISRAFSGRAPPCGAARLVPMSHIIHDG